MLLALGVLAGASPASAVPPPDDPAAVPSDASSVLVAGFDQLTDPSPELLALRDQVADLSMRTQEAADAHAVAAERAEQAHEREGDAVHDALIARMRAARARAELGRYAADAYINGGHSADIAAALEASSPTDLVTRQNMLNAVADERADLLRQLRDAQADAETAQRRAQTARAQAVAAEADAAAQARAAQDAQDEATALLATEVGRALVAQARAAAVVDAAAARQRALELAANGGTQAGAAAVAAAFTHLGKPYAWGATGPDTFDCSGLTQAAWASAGVTIPRVSRDQFSALGKVDRADLIPGDLVFFGSPVHHVGMYIGDGMMIHAPKPGDVVRVAPAFWSDYVGAARPGL